jgi:hypothetical protein
MSKIACDLKINFKNQKNELSLHLVIFSNRKYKTGGNNEGSF